MDQHGMLLWEKVMPTILVFNLEPIFLCITMAFWDALFSRRDHYIQAIQIYNP